MSIATPRFGLSPEASRLSSRAPKKRLGQHFLTAPSYARRIAEAVPAAADERVVEIGPGTGALTTYLADRFRDLHVVEKDADVLPRLQDKLDGRPCTVHTADMLTFDLGEVGFPVHVVGNLPYNVAAPILKRVLLHGSRVRSCTCMVQREVAERIAAGPGGRTSGFLSIFCQFFGETKVLFRVPPGAFFPRPRVESAVFQVVVSRDVEQRVAPERWPELFAMVDAGFGKRRKKLVRVLGDAYPEAAMAEAFERLGLDMMSRAEQLSAGQWEALFVEAFGR